MYLLPIAFHLIFTFVCRKHTWFREWLRNCCHCFPLRVLHMIKELPTGTFKKWFGGNAYLFPLSFPLPIKCAAFSWGCEHVYWHSQRTCRLAILRPVAVVRDRVGVTAHFAWRLGRNIAQPALWKTSNTYTAQSSEMNAVASVSFKHLIFNGTETLTGGSLRGMSSHTFDIVRSPEHAVSSRYAVRRSCGEACREGRWDGRHTRWQSSRLSLLTFCGG